MARQLVIITWTILLSLCYLVAARRVDFDAIFSDEPPPEEPLPKIAHFVWSKLRPLTWLEYAAIKSSLVNIGAETVNIWVPPSSQFNGPIWELVLALPEVVVREVEMPTSIYGHDVAVLAHVSDILRLEILYTEGGIYMDYNLIALRSSDPVIYGVDTESTVLAKQNDAVFCNALIMAKKHAPFLRRWMATYRNFNDSDWAGLSLLMPKKLYDEDAGGLTVLPPHAWFYPICCSESSTDMLWFGKSFWDIDENYGVHQWGGRWRSSTFITPESVREIDTPFFCRIRHLFDNVGGPYAAKHWRSDPNCSIVGMDSLVENDEGLMASYTFQHDSRYKWVDGSGNYLHGWSPYGTGLLLEGLSMVREFRQDMFTVLPVPIGYDGRSGTVTMEILLQSGHSDRPETSTLFQLRLEDDSKFGVRVRYDSALGISTMEVEAAIGYEAGHRQIQPWVKSSPSMSKSLFDDQYHTLSIAWDRRDIGLVTVRIDEVNVFADRVPIISEKLTAREIWLNGFNMKTPDANLRARLRYLNVYSSARFRLSGSTPAPPHAYHFASYSSTQLVLWIASLLLVFVLYMIIARKPTLSSRKWHMRAPQASNAPRRPWK